TPAPNRSSSRAPVLYGNQAARRVPRLAPVAAPVRHPSGVFDLPQAQRLVSSELPRESVPEAAHAAAESLVAALMGVADTHSISVPPATDAGAGTIISAVPAED